MTRTLVLLLSVSAPLLACQASLSSSGSGDTNKEPPPGDQTPVAHASALSRGVAALGASRIEPREIVSVDEAALALREPENRQLARALRNAGMTPDEAAVLVSIGSATGSYHRVDPRRRHAERVEQGWVQATAELVETLEEQDRAGEVSPVALSHVLFPRGPEVQ